MLTIPLTDSARAADIAALERKCETVEASLFRRLAPVLPALESDDYFSPVLTIKNHQ